MHDQVVKNMSAWMEINQMEPIPQPVEGSSTDDAHHSTNDAHHSTDEAHHSTDEAHCPAVVTMNCIQCALDWIEGRATTSPRPPEGGGRGVEVHYQVLVTGSMHLVGGVLGRLGFTADEL